MSNRLGWSEIGFFKWFKTKMEYYLGIKLTTIRLYGLEEYVSKVQEENPGTPVTISDKLLFKGEIYKAEVDITDGKVYSLRAFDKFDEVILHKLNCRGFLRIGEDRKLSKELDYEGRNFRNRLYEYIAAVGQAGCEEVSRKSLIRLLMSYDHFKLKCHVIDNHKIKHVSLTDDGKLEIEHGYGGEAVFEINSDTIIEAGPYKIDFKYIKYII